MSVRNHTVRSALLVPTLLVLVLAASPSMAGPKVGHAALKAMFPGTFAVNMQGIAATFHAGQGGRLTGRAMVGTDTGRWSIRGGQLCIMLNGWFSGRTRCSAVVREGNWYRADSVRFRKV